MKTIRILSGIFVLLFLYSCNQPATPEKETAAAHHHDDDESDSITLTADQIKAVNITFGQPENKNLATSLKVNGILEVPNQNKATVASLYSGILQTLNIHPGGIVRKGEVIATVANTELIPVQQQLIAVTAQLKLATLEQERQAELVAGNAAPLKNLQKAQEEVSVLRAQQQGLRQHLSAAGMTGGKISSSLNIVSPISGTVKDIHAQIGSKVDPSTPVAEIVNNSRLHLDLFVYEKDLPVIKTGQIIHFTLTNHPGKEYDAKIFSVGTAFEKESKTVAVHAEVQGDKTGLIEGMNVTAVISLGDVTKPTVPDEAIVSSGGKDYIFIGQRPAAGAASVSVERIQVIKGISDLGYTEIHAVRELPADTWIIIKGAFFVMAKMTNTVGHEH